MKFRAPNEGQEIRVATTEGGHIAIVGNDWRELPRALHKPAVAAGCVVDQETFHSEDVKAAASATAIDPRTVIEKIKDAIRKVQAENKLGDFTTDGVPKVYPVSEAAGFRVDKTDMLAAWTQLQGAKA